VKVLSLFFIDEVARYRDYSAADEKGEYAKIFEEEYAKHLQEAFDNGFMEGMPLMLNIYAALRPIRHTAATFPSTRRASASLIPRPLRAVKMLACLMT
jgi:hypothetical protein